MTTAAAPLRIAYPRQLRDYQTEAIDNVHAEWASGLNRTVVVHATGLGKGHPHDTPIQTPRGLRLFGDLRIGDQVFGSDGQPTTVTAIFERGELPTYRVGFSDHTSVLCDADHLWQVRGRSHTSATRVLSTAELMTTDLKNGHSWRWRIPMTNAVRRSEAALPIPAYTLGALIANGYLHGKGSPILSTPDESVAELIQAEGCSAFPRGVVGYCPRWIIYGVADAIKSLRLNVPSPDKFIPQVYLEASIDQRIALLRGLMDADGSSRTGGRRSACYFTTSEQLAHDVVTLVQSLGGTASTSKYDRTIEGKGIEYGAWILTPSWLHPFGTNRKEQTSRPRRTFEPHRAITSIRYHGIMSVRCIKVAAADSLYLIGQEYIVTHNTDVIAQLAAQEIHNNPHARVLVIAHLSTALDQFTARVPEYDKSLTVGRVQAERNEINCPIIAASVQTLRRPKRMAALDAAGWRPTLLIIDEVHHAMADSYLDIIEWAGCFEGVNGTRLVGVTATLIRGDNQAFDPLFSSVADVRDINWGIDHHWLVEPFGRTIQLRRNLDSIRRVAGDLSAKGVGAVIEQDARRIVKGWLREADNRITVAYTSTIEAARALLDAFREARVPSEMVIGSTPAEERILTYKRLAAGDIRVMVNVMVGTEAFDCPPVSCILICRMTEQPGLYEQMVGRGLRPLLDPHTGQWLTDPATGQWVKPDCLVLDVVGVTRKFQLVALIDIRHRRYRSMPTPVSTPAGAPRRWWQRTKYVTTDLRPRQGVLRRVRDFLFGR